MSESSASESSDQECSFEYNLNLTGKLLNKYNIIYDIGKGGLSIVWLGYNINDHKYYAIKVQDPEYYEDAIDEINFVKKLPVDPPYFNNIVDSFTHIVNNKKYMCSVWNLHACSLDNIINSEKYNNGIPYDITNKIMYQLASAIDILHNKLNVYHGDIKPDNIFIKGISKKNKEICDLYNKANFINQYILKKQQVWLSQNKDIKNIHKMKSADKLLIRCEIHKKIVDEIINKNYDDDIILTLDNCNISLGDFGTYCSFDDYHTGSFGTRYYIAPEIILKGKCSYPVDIWAFGCTYYELLSGNILFNPIKDHNFSRDYYHLCLINDTCGDFYINFIQSTNKYRDFFKKNGTLINYKKPNTCRLDRKINEISAQLKQDNLNNIKILLKLCLTEPNSRAPIKTLLHLIKAYG